MKEKLESMKILGFSIDGLRKLKAVNLEFGENGLLIVKGDNENGKTTLWDSIQWLVEGNKHLNQDIIQHGKDKVTGELRLGDYVIKRSATKKSNTLEVRNIKTNEFLKGEVQNFLNTFVNVLTFNPRPFATKTSLEKYQFCLELFKDQLEELSKETLGYGFKGIDSKLALLEEERLLVGREVKKFGDLNLVTPEKVERVDVSDILAKKKEVEDRNKTKTDEYDTAKEKQIEEINEFNRVQREIQKEIDTQTQTLSTKESEHTSIGLNIEEVEDQIKELEVKLRHLKQDQAGVYGVIHDLRILIEVLPKPLPEKPLVSTIAKPELGPTDIFDLQIQELGVVNKKAEIYETHLGKVQDKANKQTEYENLSGNIQTLRDQKLEILRKVNTGVEGLEIREDGIYHNDIFADNWSDAEGLEISCELAYANLPPMRAIFIDQGEALGKKARERLSNFAKEKDIQIGISIVADELTDEDKSADNVFWIYEGEIAPKG